MNAAAIKEHLSMLMDLEKEIYTQNQVIASLEYKLSGLPDYRQYVKPVYQQASPHYYDDTAANVAFLCLPGAVLLFVLGLLLYDFRGFFWEIALLAFIVGIIAFFISRLNASDAQHSADVESKKRYDAALKAYNLSVEQDRLRVERERPKKLLLQGQLKTLKDAHKKTVDTLNKLYNKGVIHKKYWGLVPICSLYGYFDTGVCTQLEGHEGAYNKYDTECRLDRIISKLDQVIQRLDEIKALQQDLYEAIEESNCKVGQLIRNSERISDQLTGIQSQGAELNARKTVLEEVGLKDRLGNFPAQLSGGEQQRVSIARALAKNPKMLLCDEPTGALDYQTGKAILKLLQDMCRQKGMTVVVITHNSALTPMADRVIKIKNGKVAQMTLNAHPTPVEEIEW